jgi:photosystem II stability/assembly factor-like uncharacterized protein
VTSPRDEIDDWLAGEVRPLYPQPASLDQIRHRARQRKTRQALFAAAGCAVVLAGAVTVPQLVGASGRAGGPNSPATAGSTPPSISSGTSSTASSSASAATNSSSPFQQRSYLSTTTSGFSVPRHFEPTSVTFVGVGGGNVVGAVIGQAGPPCSTSSCTSLAGTSDYGSTWYGVSAPEAPGPASSTGVSQLRFADLRRGWAFGPALYETSDGGWPWNPEKTYGQRVIDVEAAAGGPALGVFATCTGTGPDYAAECTTFSLYTSVAGSRTWTPVTLPIRSMSTGQAASASLVVTHTTGYLLAPTGDVLTGPVSGGTWRLAGKAPCAPGPAQASGLPSQAQLATSPQQLMVVCVAGSTRASSQTTLYTSTDGSAWQSAGTVPQASSVTSVASGTAGQVVLATPAGLYQSADDGATWRQASVAGGTPAHGFSYVGMTNATNGIAIPANAELGRVYVTTDGGLHWQPSSVAS